MPTTQPDPANATDGTSLSPGAGGDLITSEDMSGNPRLSPLVPQLGAANAGYKIERTKIVIGAYDQDRGDATEQAGLPVEDNRVRRLQEAILLQAIRDTQISTTLRWRWEPRELSSAGRRAGERIGRAGRDGY